MRIPLAEHRNNFLQERSRQRQAKTGSFPILHPHTTFIFLWLFAELCELGSLRAGGEP